MRIAPLILLVLIVLTAILSWVGNVYDWGLHNLLDAEGLRWAFTHVLSNLRQSPWAEIVLGLSALSIVMESGLMQVFTSRFWQKDRRSLRKLRALQITSVVALLFVVCALYFVLVPTSPLLSAFGRFSQSPFYYGLYPYILLSMAVVAATYGYASGRFLSFGDMVQALVALPVGIASYFVTLFMASQFIACLHYVLDVPLPTLSLMLNGESPMADGLWPMLCCLYLAVYFIPLITSVLKYYVKQ